jgi:hypothetical protein
MVKGIMLSKGPSASHNFFKITTQKTLLKVFSTLTYIMARYGVSQRRFECQKGWPHNLQRMIFQIDGGIGVPETTLDCKTME